MKKRCIRKHWALVDPIRHAIDGAAIAPGHVLDQLRMLELSAIEAFAKGRATVADWKSLADCLNVCETMARGGVGPEALDACDRAQAGLDEARERHNRTRRMGLSGPAIQAMRDLYEFHDLQRSSISRGEYEKWIVKTKNRILSAHPTLKMTAT